jgi:hypothetical protein
MTIGQQPDQHFLEQIVLPHYDAANLRQQTIEMLRVLSYQFPHSLNVTVRCCHSTFPSICHTAASDGDSHEKTNRWLCKINAAGVNSRH